MNARVEGGTPKRGMSERPLGMGRESHPSTVRFGLCGCDFIGVPEEYPGEESSRSRETGKLSLGAQSGKRKAKTEKHHTKRLWQKDHRFKTCLS